MKEGGLVAWPRAVVYRFKPGGGDKPAYNSAPIHDFQRSLSFAAIRSSFDKMLVEMDQNSLDRKNKKFFSICIIIYRDMRGFNSLSAVGEGAKSL